LGHSKPISKLDTVPVITPTANRVNMTVTIARACIWRALQQVVLIERGEDGQVRQ
jgi:hypothetical protein